jgi:chlorite dismutase
LQPIASGGAGYVWTVYSAKVRATGDLVSIFVCDVKELVKQITTNNGTKADAEAMLVYLRQDIKTMARIRHPCVLKVVEVIPETAKYLSVVTEPISAR